MSTPSPSVVAVRLPLDNGPPVDPFALAGPSGIVFHDDHRVRVGLGAALSIPLPHGLDSDRDLRDASAAVASIPCDDRVGTGGSGVVAFGALPFDRSAPATLVVPNIIFGSEGAGAEWVTVVVDADAGSALPSESADLRSWLNPRVPPPDPLPATRDPVGVHPRSTDDAFLAMVADALSAIERGELTKVVLARQVDVTMGAVIDVPDLLRRWRDLEPGCAIFSMPTPAGQFVGASPELVVDRRERRIRSRPLAGTAERSAGAGESILPADLLESTKDSAEHQLVVRAIEAALRPLCSDLDVPSSPDLVHLHNIIHLGTPVRGTLRPRSDGTVPDALELVGALHPTPAVGGVPTAAAVALINRLEPESRGRYAGVVGFVDGRGDGQWMLGIRAATVSGPSARLCAGVGIVDGSDPAAELVETDLKLTAVLDALAPERAPARWRGHRAAVD
jgi:menaquinone-specific isochorismate synthase